MFELVRNILINPLIWLILNFIAFDFNQNMNFTYQDTCKIYFHESYFFSNYDTNIKNIDIFYSIDSSYLTKKIKKYYENVSDENLDLFIENNFIDTFSFFYGQFYWDSFLTDFRIDISLLKPSDEFIIGIYNKKNKYMGSLEYELFFDTINIPENSKKLISNIGYDNYRIIFITLHEIYHYIDLLRLEEKYGKNYLVLKKNIKIDDEYKMDSLAYSYIDKNINIFLDIIK